MLNGVSEYPCIRFDDVNEFVGFCSIVKVKCQGQVTPRLALSPIADNRTRT